MDVTIKASDLLPDDNDPTTRVEPDPVKDIRDDVIDDLIARWNTMMDVHSESTSPVARPEFYRLLGETIVFFLNEHRMSYPISGQTETIIQEHTP